MLRSRLGQGAILVLLLAFAATGCGGGGSTTTSDSGASTVKAAATSREFKKTGANKAILTFGSEAGTAEREAASAIVTENLEARAAGEWAAQCATLSDRAKAEVQGGNPVPGEPNCEKSLKAAAQPLSLTKSARVDTLSGPISMLRVKGDRGYALFHGTDGNDYVMPMQKVNGQWKVDLLRTIRIS